MRPRGAADIRDIQTLGNDVSGDRGSVDEDDLVESMIMEPATVEVGQTVFLVICPSDGRPEMARQIGGSDLG